MLLGVMAALGAQTVQATPIGFVVEYIAYYNQSGTSSVSSNSSEPYLFVAGVIEDSTTSVFSSGTVYLPVSGTESMIYDSEDDMWLFGDVEDSFSTLTSYYPTGTYTIRLTKSAGQPFSISFNLSSSTLPPAPVVGNYSALQSIDPSQDLVLSWGSWSGGTSSDYIFVEIDNASGNALFVRDDSSSSPLRGTATSVTIPAGTLAVNQSYTLSVTFAKALYYSASGSVSDYPSAGKITSCSAITDMPIATSSVTDIFSSLTHSGGWVVPTNNSVVNSMGWIYDGSYPWIYSISEDTVANGGTYKADNKGWIYVWKDGAALTGFYFYRSSTNNWAWTNYNWNGWIYDYASSKWVDITPAK